MPHKHTCQRTDRHASQANKSNLAVIHCQHAGKNLPPSSRADKGQQALYHQHQGQGTPQRVRQDSQPERLLARWRRCSTGI
jgi:hypothetical protein